MNNYPTQLVIYYTNKLVIFHIPVQFAIFSRNCCQGKPCPVYFIFSIFLPVAFALDIVTLLNSVFSECTG